uniref:Uncharacterized protein n=1 Tax=Ceratitis capitata TaxID=7213 RepID=W8CBJ4_CERCA
MIKSSSSLKNLWLFKSSHLNTRQLVDGFVSKRGKATAVHLAENLEEGATNGNGINGNNNSKAAKDNKGTALKDNTNSNLNANDNNNNAVTNLTEAKQQTFYNNSVWLEDRSKYGHTGKELQDKIAAEVSQRGIACCLLLQIHSCIYIKSIYNFLFVCTCTYLEFFKLKKSLPYSLPAIRAAQSIF